ncbi:MAG: T9SS type A sorting domain-containing protein, partial [Candidatus Celaenobacter antarcticus]|nr:T9SS type A sorting domain-containing protein [Candidatus Celaenobacter antarcticus]
DSFYQYLLQGYEYTEWDVDEQGDLPPLSEMAKYSSVVWHSDEMFTSQFIGSVYPLKSYFIAGGNMFVSGWKHLPGPSDLFEQYLHTSLPEYNSDDDFTGAYGSGELLYLDVVEAKVPIAMWGDNLSYIYKLFPEDDAETIFMYDSSIDAPEWENVPCALRYNGDYNLYLLGFPLYYMNESEARQLMRTAMEDFGEMYAVEPQIHDEISFRVFPNPARDNCSISYSLKEQKKVKIEIFNVKGQLIEILVNQHQQVGDHKLSWNTADYPSGIYLYRLQTGEVINNSKILIIQ